MCRYYKLTLISHSRCFRLSYFYHLHVYYWKQKGCLIYEIARNSESHTHPVLCQLHSLSSLEISPVSLTQSLIWGWATPQCPYNLHQIHQRQGWDLKWWNHLHWCNRYWHDWSWDVCVGERQSSRCRPVTRGECYIVTATLHSWSAALYQLSTINQWFRILFGQ